MIKCRKRHPVVEDHLKSDQEISYQCEKDLRTWLFLLQPCRLSDGRSSDCCESEDGSDGNY